MTRQCEAIWRNQAEQTAKIKSQFNHPNIGRNALTKHTRPAKLVVKATLWALIVTFFKG